MSQRDSYSRWQKHPDAFWLEAAGALRWTRAPQQGCSTAQGPAGRWFGDGVLNACDNAVDRHVEAGHGERTALVYISAMTGRERHYSYAELQHEVAHLAGALRRIGVTAGDRVILYMPMVPEAVFAMLACARLGAVHSVVFGGFAARELAARIDDAQPVALLSASCGLEPGRVVDYHSLVQRALELAQHPPAHCIVLQREQSPASLDAARFTDWQAFVRDAVPADPVPMPANAPLYVLYTSGTTGRPKGVQRDTGSYLTALAWSMTNVYATAPGETFWAASDIGWVVGHSYIVYGPLLQGCTTILFEGKPVGTPDAGTYWRIVERHRVRTLFTAPTAIRAIKRDDPDGLFMHAADLSSLQALFLAGERADPETVRWAGAHLGVPIIDHWWQTETGWPMVANCIGLGTLPIKPGSPTLPVPGFEIDVLDAHGHALPANQQGALAVRLPLPPGCLTTLWRNDAGFEAAYLGEHPGYYTTGDGGYLDDDGYVYVMGRIDDVINIAGHRLSTGELEQALAGHAAVAECAVVGVADAIKGTVPLGLVVLKAGIREAPETLVHELIARVRQEIGPVAAFQRCLIVSRLPKTRSGKVLRSTLRALADGRSVEVPPTIEDPAVLDEIRAQLGSK